MRALRIMVAGATGLGTEQLCLNSSCLSKKVLVSSFPAAWGDRVAFLHLWSGRHVCQPHRGLNRGHHQRLGKSPGLSAWAAPAEESHAGHPDPQASLSAVGFQCSLCITYCLEPCPCPTCGCPPHFTPAFRKDPPHADKERMEDPGPVPWKGLT